MKPQFTLITTVPKRRRKKHLLTAVICGVVAALILSACGTPNFLHDAKGSTNPENWDQDVFECQNIVDRKHSVGWATFKGTMIGTVSGAGLAYGAHKLGHANGQKLGYVVAAGAIGGGILSALLGGAQAAGDNQDFVKKCLEGRGHVILE